MLWRAWLDITMKKGDFNVFFGFSNFELFFSSFLLFSIFSIEIPNW
jgi:hypothetical protein